MASISEDLPVLRSSPPLPPQASKQLSGRLVPMPEGLMGVRDDETGVEYSISLENQWQFHTVLTFCPDSAQEKKWLAVCLPLSHPGIEHLAVGADVIFLPLDEEKSAEMETVNSEMHIQNIAGGPKCECYRCNVRSSAPLTVSTDRVET